MTKAPTTVVYDSFVSRETVGIILMITALNILEDKLGDILNTCIQAPFTEKVWTTFGPEFGKDARKTARIDRAKHVLQSVVEAFRSQLSR